MWQGDMGLNVFQLNIVSSLAHVLQNFIII